MKLKYNIIQDEIANDSSSTIVKGLKININDKSQNYDFEKKFPIEFTMQFEKFNKNLNRKFYKLHPLDSTHPIKGSDIYVIDKVTGNPIKHESSSTEVTFFKLFHLLVLLILNLFLIEL